jgi:hypothetical protein
LFANGDSLTLSLDDKKTGSFTLTYSNGCKRIGEVKDGKMTRYISLDNDGKVRHQNNEATHLGNNSYMI